MRAITGADIEWLAVYEPDGHHRFYVPASELGAGRDRLSLRLEPPRNNQRAGVRMAASYATLAPLPSPPARGRGANGNTRPLQG